MAAKAAVVVLHGTSQQQDKGLDVAADKQHPGRNGIADIHAFTSFLTALNNTDADGRIIVEPPAAATSRHQGGSDAGTASAGAPIDAIQRYGSIRFVLLNAAKHFSKVLSTARSVVLVSGTLAPLAALTAQLFPTTPPARLVHFECGHVVPPQQLLAVSIGSGPSGKVLDLRHDKRQQPTVMDELGRLLCNLCVIVPDGLVAFVPSFVYLEQLTTRWQQTGVMDNLQQHKAVFT